MSNYDVLIIGGGPAGSRVAYRLADFGYKVGVFEKERRIGDHICCTGIISRECVKHFEVSQSCILREASSAKLFAPSGESLRVYKDEVQAYIVDRALFDLELAERAQSRGAEYFLASRVRGVQVFEDKVKVEVDRDGEKLIFTGKVAVIASGFASRLPLKLGLGRVKDFILGAQAEVELNNADEVEVYFGQQIAPGFFAWLVPTSQSRALVGLFSREKPKLFLKKLVEQLASQRKISAAELNISYGGIPLKPLPRTYGPRILVVGDAAGQVKPTTGGGIYYGLICADLAAETLLKAFSNGDFSGKRLAEYERSWKQKLGRELKIDYLARKLYTRFSDEWINHIFNIIKANSIHEALLKSPYLSFDWHAELILGGLKYISPWRGLLERHIPRPLLKLLTRS